MATPPTLSAPNAAAAAATRTPQRPPTPEELLAIYESKGLDQREASLKAISDLQAVLHRTLISARAASNKDRSPSDAVRKLDNLHTRLSILEFKLDTKPGYLESLAIGVASGAVLHGLGAVIGSIGNVWTIVRNASGTGTHHHFK